MQFHLSYNQIHSYYTFFTFSIIIIPIITIIAIVTVSKTQDSQASNHVILTFSYISFSLVHRCLYPGKTFVESATKWQQSTCLWISNNFFVWPTTPRNVVQCLVVTQNGRFKVIFRKKTHQFEQSRSAISRNGCTWWFAITYTQQVMGKMPHICRLIKQLNVTTISVSQRYKLWLSNREFHVTHCFHGNTKLPRG
jgi:hypothetical protein